MGEWTGLADMEIQLQVETGGKALKKTHTLASDKYRGKTLRVAY